MFICCNVYINASTRVIMFRVDFGFYLELKPGFSSLEIKSTCVRSISRPFQYVIPLLTCVAKILGCNMYFCFM